jgi:hypothetical protein
MASDLSSKQVNLAEHRIGRRFDLQTADFHGHGRVPHAMRS